MYDNTRRKAMNKLKMQEGKSIINLQLNSKRPQVKFGKLEIKITKRIKSHFIHLQHVIFITV